MPGCRKLDAPTSKVRSPKRLDLRHYVHHRARAPRACNDNRRAGTARGWYWMLAVGLMPTLGLLAVLSALL